MPAPKPQPIGPVIQDVLRRVGTQHEALAAIQRDWRRLVGRPLAAHTRPVSLRRGQLVVHVARPGESFALSYQRAQLLERLRAVTQGRVEEVVVRPGSVETRPAGRGA